MATLNTAKLFNGRLSEDQRSILYDFEPIWTMDEIHRALKEMYPEPHWDWVIEERRAVVFKHKSRK